MAKIIIIEDNPVHNTIMCHSMEDMGHEPLPFYNLDSAREHLSKESPDLFIIDVQLYRVRKPTFAFIDQLLKSKKTKHIPIIIVSAYVTKEEVKEEIPGFDPNNIVMKPFNVETMFNKVKELLKKKK